MIAPVVAPLGDAVAAATPCTIARVLVAADGRPGANPALTAAQLLAAREGAAVSVISVLEPVPVIGAELGLPAPPAALLDARRQQLEDVVGQQLRASGEPALRWPRVVTVGAPALEIARQASAGRAELIVMGIGRHGLTDRLLGSETALQVLRLADAPVLAVAPGFATLPRRVLMALDFSPESIRAARTALPLLCETAVVYLAHVRPRLEIPVEGWAAWELGEEELRAELARAEAEIGFPPAMTVETIVLRGDPARELLDVARAARVELIVVGSHGHGSFHRMIIGSVATKIMRGSMCTVLAVPPATDELCDACESDSLSRSAAAGDPTVLNSGDARRR